MALLPSDEVALQLAATRIDGGEGSGTDEQSESVDDGPASCEDATRRLHGLGGCPIRGMPLSDPGGYALRPALHGNRLAFVCDGDIWIGEIEEPQPGTEHLIHADTRHSPTGAEASGSAALPRQQGLPAPTPLFARCARLTAGGHAGLPRFSPRGDALAYVSAAAAGCGGGAEVFMLPLPADGVGAAAAPAQLTALGEVGERQAVQDRWGVGGAVCLRMPEARALPNKKRGPTRKPRPTRKS